VAHAIVLLSTFSTSPSAADISMTPAELSNSVPSGHRKRSLRTPTATASRQTRDLSNLAGRTLVATLTPWDLSARSCRVQKSDRPCGNDAADGVTARTSSSLRGTPADWRKMTLWVSIGKGCASRHPRTAAVIAPMPTILRARRRL